MPKINTYPIEGAPDGSEIVTGFKPNDGDAMANFTLQSIADLAGGGGGIVSSFSIINNVSPTSDWPSSPSQASGASGSEYSGLPVDIINLSGTKSKYALIKAQCFLRGWTLDGGVKLGFVDASNGDNLLFIGHDSETSNNFVVKTDQWQVLDFSHWMEIPAGTIMSPRVRHLARTCDLLFFPARVQAFVINLE